MDARIDVWENENSCGYSSRRWVGPQRFRVLPNFIYLVISKVGSIYLARYKCVIEFESNDASETLCLFCFTIAEIESGIQAEFG